MPAKLGQCGSTAEGVTANLVYTTEDGSRLTINSGCWLDRVGQAVDFKPGTTQKLVIAVFRADKTIYPNVYALRNRREYVPIRYVHRNPPRIAPIEPIMIGGLPCNLEIVLVDEAGVTVFEDRFILERHEEEGLNLRK